MATVKSWKWNDPSAPKFPKEFEIIQKAVLQVTDIKSNHNKYYAIELHSGKQKGKTIYRVFTHYGRTDDLETNPDAGQKECRFFNNLTEARNCYESIYREKTSPRKGYKEVSLASTKIGSQQARGTSSGEIDEKTLAKIQGSEGVPVIKPKSELPERVQYLVRYIYDEATEALTNTVAAKITAHGIETPLGILTLGQIEKGEEILMQIYQLFQKKKKKPAEFERLSGEFYTAIPHRIGRSRSAVNNAVINNLTAIEQKQNILQLMKDMLQVNGESGSVLFNAKIDQEYQALGCEIRDIPPESDEYKKIAEYVLKSQINTSNMKIKAIYGLKRPSEWDQFKTDIGNERLLFHGSRIQNWVGILSRGILLPKIVVSLGVDRTDEGWLGSGIYFGDAVCTSYFYATAGKQKTKLIALARVALGKIKTYREITYGLKAPPKGYHSCHGVRCTDEYFSEFDDDEFVIYRTEQQRLEYLVEVSTNFW
jgi:poly [ADP-ribose] polymerase